MSSFRDNGCPPRRDPCPPHDPIDLTFVVAITIIPRPPSFQPSLALLPQEPHEVDRTQKGVGQDYHVHRPPLPPPLPHSPPPPPTTMMARGGQGVN